MQNASSSEVITNTKSSQSRQDEGRLSVLKKDVDIATERMNELLERLKQIPVTNKAIQSISGNIKPKHTVLSNQVPPVEHHVPPPVKSLPKVMPREEAHESIDTGGINIHENEELAKSRNPILFMTDEELNTTPFDQLLELYGPNTVAGNTHKGGSRQLLGRGKLRNSGGGGGSGGCDHDFGVKLVDRWRNTAKECCHPIKPTDHINGTKFTCHKILQTRHHGDGDQLWWKHPSNTTHTIVFLFIVYLS